MCRHVGWVCAHVSIAGVHNVCMHMWMCAHRRAWVLTRACAGYVYTHVNGCSQASVGAHTSMCSVCVHTREWVLTRVCAGVQGVCLHRVAPTRNGRCWISSPWTLEQQPERGHEAAQQSQDKPMRREDPKFPQILPTAPGRAHGHTGRRGLCRAAQWGGHPGGHL